MEKTEMMNQSDFERLSQLMADKGVRHEAFELLADLRMSERNFAEKAQAYDRLMSGGRKTLKEWANFLGKCFAVDPDGFGYSFGSKPIIKDEHWWPDGDRIAYSAIRPDLIDFNGDWKDSLTLPDGWEEK